MKLPPIYYLVAKRILLIEIIRNQSNNTIKDLEIGCNKIGPIIDFFISLDCQCASANQDDNR